MATLASLADDVYVITARPDLVAETKVALRKAIYKCHAADTFKQDLHQEILDLSMHTELAPDSFRWAVPLSTFPRLRRPHLLQVPPYRALIEPFKEISPEDILDSYRYERFNYFFIAGAMMTVRNVTGHSELEFTYYRWPDVDPQNPIGSFICDQFPDMVIEEAAGAVFRMIGKDEEFQRYQMFFAENLAMLRGSQV